MQLRSILSDLELPDAVASLEIKDISYDTRSCKKNDLFFIRPTERFDIFSVLAKLDGTVSAFVAGKKNRYTIDLLKLRTPVIFVADQELTFHRAVDKLYEFDPHDLYCIGVTGTKGKSTVAYLIFQLLMRLGVKAALIGTTGCRIQGQKLPTPNTTPDRLFLRKFFKKAKGSGVTHLVMEVSSHGIAEERISGIVFKRCIFTNLSHEHLDYHKTMKEYFNVKKQLFLKNKDVLALVNLDSEYGRKLLLSVRQVLTFSLKRNASFTVDALRLTKSGATFTIMHQQRMHPVKSRLIGEHNVSNLLATTATLVSMGFALERVLRYIPQLRGEEGRLEQICPDVFVDYAHTPDSLKKTLRALRQIGYKKILCVFGCGGNRDKSKRRIMGRVACRLADHTFVTSDNPRKEDPKVICLEIKRGFFRKNYTIILQRRRAIESALKLFVKSAGSCLVVAGKGHEDYQIIGDQKVSFKDSRVIREIVKKC